MAKIKMQPDGANEAKRVNSFFAGIGGFDLAFKKNGFATTFYCENNEFCRSVLKRHWPTVANADDIRKLDAKDIPFADVWTAGFPCQDLSLARTPHGMRSGLKGTQSGLFYTFLELLSEHKPKVVLLENVTGLLNSHNGSDFRALIESLTNLGYAVAWRVLNARYFGAPQSRPRVFICAWQDSPAKAVATLFEDVIASTPKNARLGFMTESKCALSGISVPQVSFCISATSGRHTGLDWARSYVTYPNAVRRLTPLECERLQGLPDNWAIPDKDYVIPIRGIETNRYHAIGNAVCIPVAKWVAGRISTVLQLPEGLVCDSERLPITNQLQHLAENFLSPACEMRKFPVSLENSKWGSGGIAYKDCVVTASVSSSPLIASTSTFLDVIEKTKVHERYFLSANAVQGILRRVDKLGRHLFPPLDVVLRKIVTSDEPADDRLVSQQGSVQIKKLVAL